MSFDGDGKPGKGPGATATSLNGMPSAVTRAVKRIACNVSQQGVGTEEMAATKTVITTIGHEAAPTFFWGGKGRQGESRAPLIA